MSGMISVIIPAFNEVERIETTIISLQRVLADQEWEIIVVDDGSTDGTGELAREQGATVITLKANHGKGGAMNQGIQKASGEIILLVDADLGESVKFITPLLRPVLSGIADLAIAKFPRAKKTGGFGVVKRLASDGLYFCTGQRYQAPLSGQRALRKEVWQAINGFRPGWGLEVGMTIDAYHRGFRIVEIPLELTHRETERNWAGFFHRGEQFWDIFLTLITTFWQYRLKRGGSKR